MKNIATAALMLSLGAATVYAQQDPVTMLFSGNGSPSAINLNQPNTTTGEQNLDGNGTLGLFTFRIVRTSATSPQSSSACSGLFLPSVFGAGLFRFLDGSLLMVKVKEGGDCIDLAQMVGHCTLTLQITGGTGRFKDASGVLTFTETARPVLADAANNPVLFTETGEITGTVSGVAMEGESQDVRR